MMLKPILFLSAAVAILFWMGHSKADEPGNPIEVVTPWDTVVEAATVQVVDSDRMGTGTVISPGVVITAAHILTTDSQVVTFKDGVAAPAAILYRNALLDVALLRVLGWTPTPVEIDCTPFTRGTRFTWVGMPMGFEWNWGEGFISAIEQRATFSWLIPVSAPFNHGDSGAGILDDNHHLRGIVIGMVGEQSDNGLVLPASNFCGIGMVLQ